MSMRRKAILIASILIIVLGLVGFAYFSLSTDAICGYRKVKQCAYE